LKKKLGLKPVYSGQWGKKKKEGGWYYSLVFQQIIEGEDSAETIDVLPRKKKRIMAGITLLGVRGGEKKKEKKKKVYCVKIRTGRRWSALSCKKRVET